MLGVVFLELIAAESTTSTLCESRLFVVFRSAVLKSGAI